MKKPILYSTGCPKCKVLKAHLDKHDIEYEIVSDKQEMIKLKILSVPVLEVDNVLMDYYKATEWVNTNEKN